MWPLRVPGDLPAAIGEARFGAEVDFLRAAAQVFDLPQALWRPIGGKDEVQRQLAGTVADFCFPQFTVTQKAILDVVVDVEFIDVAAPFRLAQGDEDIRFLAWCVAVDFDAR